MPRWEDLTLGSYSLGLVGCGEGGIQHPDQGAVPFLMLKPIVTFSWASRPLNTGSFNFPFSLPGTRVCEILLGSSSVFSPPSLSPSLIVCPQPEPSSLFLSALSFQQYHPPIRSSSGKSSLINPPGSRSQTSSFYTAVPVPAGLSLSSSLLFPSGVSCHHSSLSTVPPTWASTCGQACLFSFLPGALSTCQVGQDCIGELTKPVPVFCVLGRAEVMASNWVSS